MPDVPADDCRPVPAAAIPPGVSAALVRAVKAHRALAAALLAEAGLHLGQEQLVFLLAAGPRSPGHLAAELRVEPPTVSRMIQRMARAGLVATSASSTDGRVRLVRLTAAGERAATAARDAWDQLEAASTAALSDRQRAELCRLLERVADSVAQELGDRCPPAPGC